MDGANQIAVTMTAILGTMVAILAGIISIQTPIATKKSDDNDNDNDAVSSYLPSRTKEPSKYAYEMFALCYTPIWISCFAIIIAFELYEDFTAWSYMRVCAGLAMPLLLQPFLCPSAFFGSPDAQRPWWQRYATKANVWLAIYSFIGNYWYTHYFYSVLQASYTMPAHRLNNVPLALYFATHFYFSTYHVFSNLLLRKIVTSFQDGLKRQILYAATIVVFSYFTAFMETLTISSFPYYSFEDRTMAYTVGSAFYGIYFLVSFPAFFAFDTDIDNNNNKRKKGTSTSLWDTVVSSCGYGMIILLLLDYVRLYLGIPLVVEIS